MDDEICLVDLFLQGRWAGRDISWIWNWGDYPWDPDPDLEVLWETIWDFTELDEDEEEDYEALFEELVALPLCGGRSWLLDGLVEKYR